MNLIKTSVLTTISTGIRMVAGFIINKIIAVYVGAPGLALIGQLQNFSTILMTFANGAITQGVVKLVAEHKEDIEIKKKLLSTALIVTLGCSFIISLGLFFFSGYLSNVILKSSSYSSVFILFGITIVLFALNTLLMSVLNGQREIKKYIIINILSSLVSVIFTSLLIIKLQLIGALYALVTNQSIVFFITLGFVLKASWFKVQYFIAGVDKKSLIKLGHFALMALTSALTVPVSQLLVRNYVVEHLSLTKAGYWQGVNYISNTYLLVITTSLNVYYLPRLSEIKNNLELKKELISGYMIVLPLVTFMASMIFIFKKTIISIIFTDKFIPMLELFKWQLAGDVVKIASFLLGNLLLAKAMTKLYIYTEVIFSTLFVVLSICCIKMYGVVGATYAFFLTYLLHFLTMAVIYKRNFYE